MLFRKPDANDHNALLIIIACGLLLFLSLGAAEIQPWDEALYAVRARAVVEHQAWWDQTPHSLGGIYSSASPPLTVWAMALSINLFGETAFALRLYGVLCAFASLALMYLLARRLFTNRPFSATSVPTALIAPALLCGTIVWNHYARLGMADAPLVAYSLAALWALLNAVETTKASSRVAWGILYALACAAALMTKMLVSLFPLCFVFYPLLRQWLSRRFPQLLLSDVLAQDAPPQKAPLSGGASGALLPLLFFALLGVCIALPWYWSMASLHGSDFTKMFFAPYLTSVAEDASHPTGVLYYINQLLVANPFLLLCFLWCALALYHLLRGKGSEIWLRVKNPALEFLLALWFVLLLAFLSLTPTKMPHYTLLLLPPALLLSLSGFELLTHRYSRSRIAWVGVLLLFLACVWSLSVRLRSDVQLLWHGVVRWDALLFVVVAVLLLCSVFILREQQRLDAFVRIQPYITSVLPLLLVLHVGHINVLAGDDYTSGGREVQQWLSETGHRSFVHLYHYHQDSDTLLPQLAWYTRNWTCGKKERKRFSHVALPPNALPAQTIDSLQRVGQPLLYTTSSNDTLSARLRLSMRNRREEYVLTPGYIVFSAPLKEQKSP